MLIADHAAKSQKRICFQHQHADSRLFPDPVIDFRTGPERDRNIRLKMILVYFRCLGKIPVFRNSVPGIHDIIDEARFLPGYFPVCRSNIKEESIQAQLEYFFRLFAGNPLLSTVILLIHRPAQTVNILQQLFCRFFYFINQLLHNHSAPSVH